MSKKASNPEPTFKKPPPPPPPPRKAHCFESVRDMYSIRILRNKDVTYEQFLKDIEEALKVPGNFVAIPLDMQCIEEPREIIRELLDGINDIPFTDEELIKAIKKAENYLKEITGR